MDIQLLLIKNADVYAPAHIGRRDLLLGGGRVLAVEERLDIAGLSYQTLDARGCALIPGLIDQHVHVTGGGGEGGFHTRTPEFTLSCAVRAGVTTLVGLLGTDGYTKTVQGLVAKVKALTQEGITAYCLTGSYQYPSITATGSVAGDILYIQEVLGCKLAIADHRGSHPTKDELIRLASDIRMASLVSGKPGILHLHVGAAEQGITPLMEIARETDLPITLFRPTHMGRHPQQAMHWLQMGGYADITAGSRALDTLPALMAKDGEGRLTLSSDSNGSMPKWNADHTRMVGMGVGDIASLWDTVRRLVWEGGMPLENALPLVTANVARGLEIYPRKGALAEGSDADAVLLSEDGDIRTVIAGGRTLMADGSVLVKGTFE